MADFGNAGKWTKEILSENLKEGARVIDATMGNGHDTLFLAQTVGESGHVWAFDVQDKALENTRARLSEVGLMDRVTLIKSDHALMENYVGGDLDAVVFNLGWLPGQAHVITTNTDSTLKALEAALRLIKVGGFITVCVYPGHEEGQRELEAIGKWIRNLDDKRFDAVSRGYENLSAKPPKLFTVAKKQ